MSKDTYTDQVAYDALIKARVALIMHSGWQGAFYAPLAMRLDLIEDRSMPTAATDGKHLFYNPEYIMSLSEALRVGLIVHEANHCASLHHHRMGFKPLDQWNTAVDYPTNEAVRKAGFAIKDTWLHDPKFYDMAAEDIYHVLFPAVPPQQEDTDEPEDEPDQADDSQPDSEPGNEPEDAPGSDPTKEASEATGEPGSEPSDGPGSNGAGSEADDTGEPASDGGQPGSGSGGNGASGSAKQSSSIGQPGTPSAGSADGLGTGEPDPTADAEQPDLGPGGVLPAYKGDEQGEHDASPEAWEQAVRQAVSLAKARGWGSTMPGSIEQVLGDIEAGKHDWKTQFREFTDNRVATRPTWKRLNRRYATANFAMPGSEVDGLEHVLCIIDTSGSMDTEWLGAIKGEIQSAMDEKFIHKLTVLCVDMKVQAVYEFEQGDEIEFNPIGRGDTKFSPAFEWMRQSGEQFSCAVYLTDLDCGDFGNEPDCPLLWAVYGRYWNRPVPFGETVRLI